MKNNKLLNSFKGFCILGCVIGLFACGPVYRFTQVKNVPREYIRNYNVEGVKAPRNSSWFKRNPWIVFAQEAGTTYMSPSGKNEMQKVEYMDAFLVIKQKGDWLRLVKYDPAILKNGRLKEWKQAKYAGWINKNDLLLTRSSVTDLLTGFKNKQVVMLTDTIALREPEKYFANDSVKLFRNTDLTQEATKVPFYGIVYPYKQSADKRRTLVTVKPMLNPDSVGQTAIGWIDNTLLTEAGQQLHVDITSLPDSALTFVDRFKQDTLTFTGANIRQSRQFAQKQPAIRYNPVLTYRRNDTALCFKTHLPMPIIDKRDSYVLNVNGNPIYYSYFRDKIGKDLQKINLVFVLEGKEETIKKFPAVVNAIQGLQPQLSSDEMFSFRYGAVLTFNEPDSPEDPICKLTADYMEMLDFLSNKAQNADKLKPVYGMYGSWSGMRLGASLFSKYPDETNILVVVGDKGFNSEWADSTLVNRLVKNNCRVLGFQLYGGEPDNFNNFVLQIGNMIDCYAPRISRIKRELIVYPDQIRNRNEYVEVNHNTYCLDFPACSMTQGWLVFPQKNEALELEGLTNAIDSMLLQVKFDNTLLSNSLAKAFEEVGTHRYKLDSTLVNYNHIADLGVQPVMSTLTTTEPGWKLPVQPVVLPNSISPSIRYFLLANEEEFKRLRNFIETPAKLTVDYKYEATKKKRQTKVKICDCPDDELLLATEEATVDIKTDSLGVPEYASTWKVRRQLVHHFLFGRNTGKYCKIGRRTFLRMPIAEVQRRFTSCPVDNPFFEVYRLKDLKKKKMISDAEIDRLLEYFKQKKQQIDEVAGNTFQSNGQNYYWISRELLP